MVQSTGCSGVVQSKDELRRWWDNGIGLTGLTPNTTYTIRVATVEGYVGLYSSPIYVWTTELGI